MDENHLIKENLDNEFNQLFLKLNKTSFAGIIKEEYQILEETAFIGVTSRFELFKIKRRKRGYIRSIEKDKALVSQIDNLHQEILNLDVTQIKAKFKEETLLSFSQASQWVNDKGINHELKIILLIYGHDFKAYLCGYGHGDFEYPILTSPEYVDYNYKKELFNGEGEIDYSSALEPVLKIRREVDEEKMNIIEDFVSEYIFEVITLCEINAYRILHEAFAELKEELSAINIPKHPKVYIYGSEHDCGMRNIYVW